MLKTRDWQANPADQRFSQVVYLFTPIDGDDYATAPINYPALDAVTASADADWIAPEHEVTRLLVDSFSQIPQVVSICAQFGPDGITIWTLLNAYDRDAREAVYKKEMELCDRLGSCDFDFRVSTIDLVNSKELVRGGLREIFIR